MKTYTPNLFADIRKLNDLTQIDMAKKLNVSQSAISKLEAGVFVPELTLWFDFVREFGLLDPYCFYYGTAELKNIPDLNTANRTNWQGVWTTKQRGKFGMTIRALAPLLRHLSSNSEKELKALFRKHGAPLSVTSVLNYPVPWEVVWDVFELADQKNKRFNLSTMAPSVADHGGLFKQVPRDQGKKGIMEFLMNNSGEYFGKTQLNQLDAKDNGLPSVPEEVRKSFMKYLNDYPAHLAKKPAFELTA